MVAVVVIKRILAVAVALVTATTVAQAPVAAVAANSPHVAEEALALIDVDYEVLPAVLNADDAMKDGAAILHERLLTMSSPAMRSGGWGEVAAWTDTLQDALARRMTEVVVLVVGTDLASPMAQAVPHARVKAVVPASGEILAAAFVDALPGPADL